MNVSPSTTKRAIAALELLLISPAVLFMTALFARNVQPEQYEPARTAGEIVTWYAARRGLGLSVFLVALPLAVLVTGCTTLFRSWHDDAELREATRRALTALRAHMAIALVATATVTAGGILAIVALHVITD